MDGLKNRHDINHVVESNNDDFELRPLFDQNEIPFEEKIKRAELNIIQILKGLFIFILIIAIICFLVGYNGVNWLSNSEEDALIGESLLIAFVDIILYIIIKPLIVILIGISQNIREINKKLK